jgi:hypothetical protein
MNTLHVYGQKFWHEPLVIVGSTKALINLREALDQALVESGSSVELMCSDGDGYDLVILCEDPSVYPVPYIDEDAQDHSDLAEPAWKKLWQQVRPYLYKEKIS